MALRKRYSVAVVAAIIALILAVLGALSLTIWKPAQEVSATTKAQAPFVMIREGVLGLYADEVTVTVSAASASDTVWLARGAGSDVAAWLQGQDFEIVAGTSSLHELAVETHLNSETAQSADESAQSSDEGSEEETTPADEAQSGDEPENPIKSDMWTSLVDSAGTLTVTLSGEELSDVILISEDGKSPNFSVTLTWPTPQPNYLVWVFFPLAGIFAVAAAIVAAVVARSNRRSLRTAKAIAASEVADSTDTGVIAIQTDTAAPAIDEPASPVPDAGEPVHEEPVHKEPLREEAAPAAQPQPPARDLHTEEITTASGMMNLAALQGGGRFPTRRALRDARARGVENLSIEGHDFTTASTASSSDTSEQRAPSIPPVPIQWRSRKSAQKFGTPSEDKE